jgi:hypothetical protein
MSLDWLKHAFAIEAEGPVTPTPSQSAVIDRLCGLVVERGLTTPALIFLESVHPLNYVSAQTLHFFAPIISAIADPAAARELAEFLEHRGSVAYLCQRLQDLSVKQPTGDE